MILVSAIPEKPHNNNNNYYYYLLLLHVRIWQDGDYIITKS